MTTQSPISIFFSYSHLDEALRDELAKHLRLLERQGAIAAWHDRKITAGQEWKNQIDHHLETAQIILLLISVDFLNSDYCYDLEMTRAMQRHKAEEAKVVPIILRPVDWETTPFHELQALPKDGLPITKWQNQDEAFMTVAKSLRGIVEEMAQTVQSATPIKSQASTSSDAATLSLWVHGWKRRDYDGSPTEELDWTEYFDLDVQPRQIADQITWNEHLLPSLEKAKKSFPAGSVIDIRGLLPLSAALAIGTKFLDAEGYTLQVLQRTAGQEVLWRSTARDSTAAFHIVQEEGQLGDNLLVMLAITGQAREDVLRLYRDSNGKFDAVVYAEPVAGTGERAISSAADAVALAIDARRLIRDCRDRYHAKCVHLVLFCPVGFALFLGQRLRFVGEVLTYEFVNDRTYQPSVRLRTN